jgi:hypothetical protein
MNPAPELTPVLDQRFVADLGDPAPDWIVTGHQKALIAVAESRDHLLDHGIVGNLGDRAGVGLAFAGGDQVHEQAPCGVLLRSRQLTVDRVGLARDGTLDPTGGLVGRVGEKRRRAATPDLAAVLPGPFEGVFEQRQLALVAANVPDDAIDQAVLEIEADLPGGLLNAIPQLRLGQRAKADLLILRCRSGGRAGGAGRRSRHGR